MRATLGSCFNVELRVEILFYRIICSNATYISNTTQNDLSKSAGTVIQNKILEKVSEAKFFSLLVDEITDLSKQEQMTICLCMCLTTRFVRILLITYKWMT